MKRAAAAGTIGEALAASVAALEAAGVDSPRLDAELLLAEASGRDRSALLAHPEEGVEPPVARAFGAMVRRRIVREPVAYILGRKGFRELEVRCDPRALIPRPETELLVEVAVEAGPRSVLDVGTGTGAIAMAIAAEVDGVEVVAIDTSPPALALARENADALRLAERVTFELGALPRPRQFDLVVANLPYVRDQDFDSLPPEIKRFEPREALLGGTDGLDPIRGLIAALTPGSGPAMAGLGCSMVALEIGEGQGKQVGELVAAAGFSGIELRPDLAGIERVVLGRR